MIDIASFPPVLSMDEIKTITRSCKRDKIIQSLNILGIPFKIAGDGYPVVSRLAYEQSMGVNIAVQTHKPKLHLGD